MSVAFSVNRTPALKRFLWNGSQRSATLTPNVPAGCKKRVSQLGLSVGGQAGADVGCELGISGSRDTILRLVRRSLPPAKAEPRIIGLDDWARRRRLRYGTLVCDLERSQPIDLLPDRSVERVEAWLKAHPSLEVVSRDGSSEYASAIGKGAPQAHQVSDRWHLVKNL